MRDEPEIVGGRYHLEELVGSGAGGRVFRGLDTHTGKTVAVKVLGTWLRIADSLRFLAEARALADIHHPNVIRVWEVGEEQQRLWTVMDFVSGGNMEQYVARWGALAPEDAIRVMIQVMRGLTAIHAAGYVHRDMKPQNLLRYRDGRIVVTDLGMIRHLHDPPYISLPGKGFGTPGYRPPEQNFNGGLVTFSADVFSTGAVMAFLLTGRTPAISGAPYSLEMIGSVPRALRVILEETLRARPQDRMRPEELLCALEAV